MKQLFSSSVIRSFNFILYRYRFLGGYVVIGISSISLELICFRGLETIGLISPVPNVIGLLIGMLFAFWMNVRFNFKITPSKRRRAFILFMLISSISASVNFLFKNYLVESGWSYEKSRFIISGCLFLVGYILHRKFSFSEYKRVGVAVYANGQEDISGIHEKIGSFPDFIHVDIIDSSFGEDKIDPKLYRLETIRAYWPNKQIHIHIMSKNPSEWIPRCTGFADIIFFHYEIDESIDETIKAIQTLGMHPGLVLTMKTPVESAEEYMDRLEHLMLLTIPKPGRSGQQFEMNSIYNIDKINAWKTRRKFCLCVDGGVSERNVHMLNIEEVVSGSSVMRHQTPKKQIMRLQTSNNYEYI